MDEGVRLFYDRINKPTYYQFGAYQLDIELLRALFLDGEDKPPRLKNETWQGWTLNQLANTYGQTGQPRLAADVLTIAIPIAEKLGEKGNVATGLANVAIHQFITGSLSAAENNLCQSIDLCREIPDEFVEAIACKELARVLLYRGEWQETEQKLITSQQVFDKYDATKTNSISVVRAYRAQLLISIGRFDEALKFADESLNVAIIPNRSVYGGERDIIRAHWILGSAYRMNNEMTRAEENLAKALNLCRQINMVDHEADILLDIARLRYAQNDFKDAQEKAEEALIITERSGYVLQGADVNLFLAQYALEQEKDKAKAKQYAEEAKKLATCDGPPYYYKVAYEEAERMLEKLK